MKNKLFNKLLPIYGLELRDKQVVKLLNISIATLYRMRANKEINYKKKAMECYESECRKYPHPRSIKSIDTYANYFGISSGFEYAEPFKLMLNTSGEL